MKKYLHFRKNILCKNSLYKSSFIAVLVLIFTACAETQEDPSKTDFLISGSVGDGPIVNADVTVYDAQNNVLAQTLSDASASYNVSIPYDSNFPITVKATSNATTYDVVTNLPPDFELLSAAINSGSQVVNITPFSTLAVLSAEGRTGGLNSTTLTRAKSDVLGHLSFGLNPLLAADVISSPLTSTNAANIVKSSEAISEYFRRTQTALNNKGLSLDIDSVIGVLADDLSDGVIDGNNINSSNNNNASIIAAIANIISAQVLLETITNTLTINGGQPATQALNTAILLVAPNSSMTSTDVVITTELIEQTKRALFAAETVLNRGDISSFANSLDSFNSTPQLLQINAITPSVQSISLALIAALNDLTINSGSKFDVINNVIRDGVDTSGGTGNGGTGNNIQLTSTLPTTYIWTTLQSGTTVFVDRTFTYTTLPAGLLGLEVLQTANNDKSNNNPVVITFNVSVDATIYVALDVRVTSIPAWLSSGWSQTGAVIVDSDTTRNVWAKDYATGLVSLGGNGSADSSMYTVIAKAGFSAGGPIDGGGGNTNFIVSNDQGITTNLNQLVNIDILGNDTYPVNANLNVTIINTTTANNGSAILAANNTVNYTPANDYFGPDSFSYQVSDGVNTGTATVNLNVLCNNCADQKTISVSWNANSTTDQVTGYKLYWGSSAQTSTTLLKTISVVNAGFDPAAPATDFNGWDDFKSQLGATVCIKISAYNVVGESSSTSAICRIL